VTTKKWVNEISYQIVGCAIEVHMNLGPGLLESIYHQSLYDEINNYGLSVKSNIAVPISYKGKELGEPLRMDLLVEDLVIVELKAVEIIHPVYKAQLLTYMKLSEKPKGLLINFHTENITKGLTPLVNEIFASLPDG
jgi:GxxExxY protein